MTTSPPWPTSHEECLRTLRYAREHRCVCCGADDDLEWFGEELGLCATFCASYGLRDHTEFRPMLREMVEYALKATE